MNTHTTPAAIRDQLHATLAPIIPRNRPVALIGFPNYDNVGDSAIWCGTMAWLAQNAVPVVYHADEFSYHPDALDAALPKDGLVLFQGGGNFGDLYPWHQELRVRVMRTQPHRQFVQLPQTIEFRDPSSAVETSDAIAAVRSFVFLGRERRTVDLAHSLLGVDAILSPDMAFALAPGLGHARGRASKVGTQPVLWLARSDAEALQGRVLPPRPSVRVADWPDLDRTFGRAAIDDETVRQLVRRFGSGSSQHPCTARAAQPWLTNIYRRLASRTVANGIRLLTSAEVVVTDRLHGHVLSTLVGSPQVILESGFGKVRACYDEFTSAIPNVRFAADPQQALELALSLLDQAAGATPA